MRRSLLRRLIQRTDEQLAPLRERLKKGMRSIVYGVTTGPELSDMHPFLGTATRFLREVRGIKEGAKAPPS